MLIVTNYNYNYNCCITKTAFNLFTPKMLPGLREDWCGAEDVYSFLELVNIVGTPAQEHLINYFSTPRTHDSGQCCLRWRIDFDFWLCKRTKVANFLISTGVRVAEVVRKVWIWMKFFSPNLRFCNWNLEICKDEPKRHICRENSKYAHGKKFICPFFPSPKGCQLLKR